MYGVVWLGAWRISRAAIREPLGTVVTGERKDREKTDAPRGHVLPEEGGVQKLRRTGPRSLLPEMPGSYR